MGTILMIATPSAGSPPRIRRLAAYVAGTACVVALMAFVRFAHPFLAIDAPVAADTLVIEGWLPEYAMERTVAEVRRGNYQRIIIPGMVPDGDRAPDQASISGRLEAAGVSPDRIIVVLIPPTRWNRTSSMARAVRNRLAELDVIPKGVNIITLGPHARQSHLAYSRMLGPGIPTGVINFPKSDYDPERWWASPVGIQKTTTHFAGWLRELALGLRS